MNNPEQADLNNLNEQQLTQLLFNIQTTIGKLEIDKQVHIGNAAIVAMEIQKKQKQQMPVVMPTLKKINLPKQNENVSYTLNTNPNNA
jgi:hypothetical protein